MTEIIWMTGLSGSGKTTLGTLLYQIYTKQGKLCKLLDGDLLRRGLNKDLGFLKKDRSENVRRVAEVAKLFSEEGIIPIVTLISPYENDREMARTICGNYQFVEAYIDCSIEECENRDPKGLYTMARTNNLKNFTGLTDAYETPIRPDIIVKTENVDINTSILQLCTGIKNVVKNSLQTNNA